MVQTMWQVINGDPHSAARDFLGALFDKQIVNGMLVPVRGTHNSVTPALVMHPNRLDQADPFAPVMLFNSARLVSMLTREASNQKIGVVLRSCEIRALIELVKFNQVKLDHTIIIGVDCVGTLTAPQYTSAIQQFPDLADRMLAAAKQGNLSGLEFRSACAMCEHPAPEHADISVGFIGVDHTHALAIDLRDDLAQQMGLGDDPSTIDKRNAALANLIVTRIAHRDATLKEFHDRMRNDGGFASYFADCLECTNCMNACPICYCKECFFRTANAERSPRELLRLADRQGALAMPPNALLFHLTRLNHMATSCIGCGMCEAACPHDIPLTAMFRAVGSRVQKIFDYTPGRNMNDKPPFMEFKQNELQSIGEME
ncbi:MAG: 4Fe-4S dicluster domain-containing protein [Chloroflexi bacterium]|nr:4Fe-4S dicluster domain-containing protein [Chloroflexota bacterium]